MTQERKLQVSDKIAPKPIPQGQVKKFKLIGAGAIDPATGLPAFNAGAVFPGTTTIYDSGFPGGGRPVTIKNIVGETVNTDKDGRQTPVEIIEDIEFDGHGMIYVNHMQPNLYLLLSRSDNCGTNPYRDKSKPVVWEEIIPVNIKEKQKIHMDLRFEAMKIVRDSDAKEIKAIAKVLCDQKLIEVNVEGNISDVRYEVERYTDINPSEIIRAAKDKEGIIKLDIHSANDLKEIAFYPDNNEWQWVNKPSHENSILSVEPGKDAVEELVKFLLKEEEDNKALPADQKKVTTYKKIKDTLKELSV